MNGRLTIGAPKRGPSYAANRKWIGQPFGSRGSIPRLNHKKVLPMSLGEIVTYVLEHSLSAVLKLVVLFGAS